MINLDLIYQSLPAIAHGTLVTLEIASGAAIIGLCLGTLIALGQRSHITIIKCLAGLYVTIIRGTPMLFQITFFYYVLPQFGISIPAFWLAIAAIGFNSAAYISQVVRSGIGSVGIGQWEAAHVLGLTRWQTMRYIVLPQAFAFIIPALGNEFVTLIKDSALASVISVYELTKEAAIIRSRTFDAITTYTMVAIVYLCLTTTLTLLINRLEKRLNPHARN